MSPRRISSSTPNQTAAKPATVAACRQDYGTASERAARADDAIGQNESAKFHAKESAESLGGRRTT
jgi:hypothetical protein